MQTYRHQRKDGVGQDGVGLGLGALWIRSRGDHGDVQQMRPAGQWVPPDPVKLCEGASGRTANWACLS